MARPTSRASRTPAAKGRRGGGASLTNALLDGLPAAIAQLGPDGCIQLTNKHWRRPGPHGALRGPTYRVGVDYLTTCRRAAFPPGAGDLAAGITKVLAGELPVFSFEYGGRPEDKAGAWFRIMVTPAEGGVVLAHVDVSERRQQEVDAGLREDVLTRAQEIAHLGQWEFDLTTGALTWSDETHRIFGLEPGTFEGTYEAFLARLHPDDQAWTDQDRRKALRQGKVLERDYRLVRPDGSARWVHEWGEAELSPEGKPVQLWGVVLDITERRRAELRLERLQRLYAMQSRINEAIVMARTPEELFQLSCSAAIREGGLRMAFIARIDQETGALEPVAWEGHVEGYLKDLRITTDDSPHAQGPMGTALQTGQLAGSADIAEDPLMAPWREAALSRGYRSAAAIPLLIDGQSVGAMSLFSGEAGYFQEEERHLLVAVGENLSYALAAMAQRVRQKASEAALRRSEHRFTAAFEHAAGGIALVGLDGRLLKVNRGFGALLGYEPAELERLRFQDITHPGDLKRDQNAFKQVVQGKRPSYQARKRYLKKDGSLVWVQISTALVRDADGSPLHCITQIQDLTEQELAIADLARLRRQSDLILASVVDGIHGIDREGRILFENPAAVAMLGWSKEELLGQDAHTLFHNKRADGAAHDRAECPIHQTLADGVLRQVDGDWFRRKDGTSFPVAYSTHPLMDETGAIAGVVVTFRDISRDLAQRADLERNQALMRMAGGLARLGAWSVELPIGQVHWSDEVARIHGVSPGYAPTVDEGIAFYAPEHRLQVREALERCARDGTPVDLEVQIINRQGERLWVHTLGEAVRDASGAIIRIQGAFQDISSQKALEQALRSRTELLRISGQVARIGGWAVDLDTQEVFWSDIVLDILERPSGSQAPLLAQAMDIYPENIRGFMVETLAACAAGQSFSVEVEVLTAKGNRRWARIWGEPERDAQGRIHRIYGAAQDITDRKAIEAERARLQEDLFQTLETISDGFITLDRDWRFTYANGPAERIMRRPRHEVVGRSLWELFPEAVGSVFEQAYREAVEQRRTVVVEARYAPLDLWVEEHVYPTEAGLAMYIRDITERRKGESALRESEERFRLLAKATRDAIWDWNLETDDLWWNEGYFELFGYRPDEVASDLSSWDQRIHPDDRARVEAGLQEAIAGKGQAWSAEYRYLRADGSAAYVLDRGHLIRNAEGKAVRMIGGMTDLTSQRESAERLREQADLLDRANDAIQVRDFSHHILYWNAAAERLYGWTPEEAIGQRADRLLGSDPALIQEAMTEVRTTGEWQGRIPQRTRDGRAVTVEGRWSLVKAENGSPKAVLAIHTDITERLSLEEQLFQAQKLDSIGQLTGGIAHDFNNLLTVIIGNAELLARKSAHDPSLHRLAGMVLTAGERGAELTRRLLAFARRQPLQPRAVDLEEILRGTEGLLRRAVGEPVEVELRLQPGLWPVLIDPVQLEAAILNLGVNARDAMPGGGRLTIEAHNETEGSGSVCLRVSDAGTGMPPEILKRIFEPFFTTKEKGKGTGLGLSMVYGFIRQSGGEIEVESELGQGTVFSLRLPRAQGPAAEPEPESTAPAGGGTERILLVEDDDMVRSHSADLLTELGYQVMVASSGPEALAILESSQPFDLLFTDVIMAGGMDGAALAERARALRPSLPVLFTSGYTENSLLRDGQVDPGVDLLLKPYLKDSLTAKVREVLDRAKSQPRPSSEGTV